MTSDRFPGHQGIRFSQVVVGGFSPVEESLLPARQGQAARLSVRTPFCKPAFDLALDAKNSPSGSAMVGNRLPLDLKGFHSGFIAAFAAMPCRGPPLRRNIPVSILSFA